MAKKYILSTYHLNKRTYTSLLIFLSLLNQQCFSDHTGADDIEKSKTAIQVQSNVREIEIVVGSGQQTHTQAVIIQAFGAERSGSISGRISIDNDLSTAIEGLHYMLPEASFEFDPSSNFIDTIQLTILKNKVTPPLSEKPMIALKFEGEFGENHVVNESPQIELDYRCFADLAGTYTVTNDFCSWEFRNIQITSNPDGSWFAQRADGGFLCGCTAESNQTMDNTGKIKSLLCTTSNPGSFREDCGEILPSNDLQYGELGIGTILGGTWEQGNGVLILKNRDTFFNGGPYEWTSTYIRE